MVSEVPVTMTKAIEKTKAVGKDDFLAKKSSSYKTDIADDKDVWCEYLAVVEIVVPANSGATKTKDKELYELEIKSFFESSLTGKRTWDEPPSGATTIQYATDEDHQRAENEKMNLQATTRNFANDNIQPKERMLSKLNIFRKWRSRKNRQGFASHQQGRGAMKNRAKVTATARARQKTESEKQQDINLDEQDAIAMAQALSLSEQEADVKWEREQENTMLNVIYESKTGSFAGATGLAYAGGARGEEGLIDVQEDEDNDGMVEQYDVQMEESGGSEDDGNFKMPAT